jgi:hypothetical protein
VFGLFAFVKSFYNPSKVSIEENGENSALNDNHNTLIRIEGGGGCSEKQESRCIIVKELHTSKYVSPKHKGGFPENNNS